MADVAAWGSTPDMGPWRGRVTDASRSDSPSSAGTSPQGMDADRTCVGMGQYSNFAGSCILRIDHPDWNHISSHGQRYDGTSIFREDLYVSGSSKTASTIAYEISILEQSEPRRF